MEDAKFRVNPTGSDGWGLPLSSEAALVSGGKFSLRIVNCWDKACNVTIVVEEEVLAFYLPACCERQLAKAPAPHTKIWRLTGSVKVRVTFEWLALADAAVEAQLGRRYEGHFLNVTSHPAWPPLKNVGVVETATVEVPFWPLPEP